MLWKYWFALFNAIINTSSSSIIIITIVIVIIVIVKINEFVVVTMQTEAAL